MAYITPQEPPEGFECRGLFVPIGQDWGAILAGALYALTLPTSFEQVSGLTAEQTAAVFALMWKFYDKESCPMFPGMITISAGSIAPSGWLVCDGAAYEQTEYTALYAAIGTTFGNDGAGTFRVPDMRSRLPVGVGQGTGLTDRVLAATGGVETVTLNANQLWPHTHSIASMGVVDVQSGTGTQVYGVTGGSVNTNSRQTAGPHENMPPFLALNFLIYAGA